MTEYVNYEIRKIVTGKDTIDYELYGQPRGWFKKLKLIGIYESMESAKNAMTNSISYPYTESVQTFNGNGSEYFEGLL